MNILKRTKHLGQWIYFTNSGTPSSSIWENTSLSTVVSTINCLAYQENENLSGTDQPQTAKRRWQVLVPKDLSSISEGNWIQGIVDKNGDSVFAGGKVLDVLVISHPDRGVECRIVTIDPN